MEWYLENIIPYQCHFLKMIDIKKTSMIFSKYQWYLENIIHMELYKEKIIPYQWQWYFSISVIFSKYQWYLENIIYLEWYFLNI